MHKRSAHATENTVTHPDAGSASIVGKGQQESHTALSAGSRSRLGRGWVQDLLGSASGDPFQGLQTRLDGLGHHGDLPFRNPVGPRPVTPSGQGRGDMSHSLQYINLLQPTVLGKGKKPLALAGHRDRPHDRCRTVLVQRRGRVHVKRGADSPETAITAHASSCDGRRTARRHRC
mgnify:CR=1 FL=1